MAGRVRTAVALGLTAAFTPLIASAQLVILRTGWARPTRLPRMWFRFLVHILDLRVRIHGKLADERPLLIVANHVSWLDIVALGSIGEISFVARGDMIRWPLIGPLSKLGNTVFVDRNRRTGSAEQAGQLAGHLAAGSAVVLFAEGTTGDGNRLRPFKSSLLGAAEMLFGLGNGSSPVVQPVAIDYTRNHGIAVGRGHRMRASWIGDEDLVPHLRDFMARDVLDVDIHLCAPFAFSGGMDRKQAARQAEQAIRDAIGASRQAMR